MQKSASSPARIIGLIGGIAVSIILATSRIDGLSTKGVLFLAFTMLALIFWIFNVMDSGLVGALYLILLAVFQVDTAENIFAVWAGTVMWLIIGAFLIAQAVISSRLCDRISCWFLCNFVRGYRSLIITIFVLSAVMSLFIPNPWPRSLIIVTLVKKMTEGMKREAAAFAGLAVFVASIPTCFLFLTSAASMNQLVLGFAGAELSWLAWFRIMFFPGLGMTLLFLLVVLLFSPESGSASITKAEFEEKLKQLGPLTSSERRIIIWLSLAIVLWMTDSWHKINVAWVSLGIAAIMRLPLVGCSFEKQDWHSIPTGSLLYITAAAAIGKVGTNCGITAWLTGFFPPIATSNLYILALLLSITCMTLHLFLGSTISANSVLIPAMLAYTQGSAFSSVPCALICYVAIFGQFLFPYQHMNIYLGLGDVGLYSNRDVLRVVLPLTVAVLITIECIMLPWWKLIGFV